MISASSFVSLCPLFFCFVVSLVHTKGFTRLANKAHKLYSSGTSYTSRFVKSEKPTDDEAEASRKRNRIPDMNEIFNKPSYYKQYQDYDDPDEEKPLVPPIRTGAFGAEGRLGVTFHTEGGGMGKNAYYQITPILENLISRMAINSTAYYSDMMGDQATMRWMRQVKGFDNDGLKQISWQEYMLTMMEMDPFDTRVRMPASKQALFQLIGNNNKLLSELKGIKNRTNICIEYTQRIEPRKVCNQIIKDRQILIQETIVDLQSVYDENQEAMRYAQVWKDSGKKQADESRVLCREDYEGDSSPFRGENFVEITILILNLAIDLLKSDLIHKGLPSALPGTAPDGGDNVEATKKFLDDFASLFVYEVEVEDDFFPFTTTVIDDRKVSRTMLETLHYKGITEGFYSFNDNQNGGTRGTVNILKLSRDLMDKRVIIAQDMIRILSTLIENDTKLFKMITDYGGFKKFDMESKPNFKIIDLEKEREEKESMIMERKKQEEIMEEEAENVNLYDGEIERSVEFREEDGDVSRDVDEFGLKGPELM